MLGQVLTVNKRDGQDEEGQIAMIDGFECTFN